MTNTSMRVLSPAAIVLLVLSFSILSVTGQITHVPLFDGENAYTYLVDQCDFGPRPPGSENLSLCAGYIAVTLESFGWNITYQNFTYQETACSNLIATWNATENASLVFGAHYDTRPEATSDPDPLNRTKPILGANDGASGTAVLIELARILSESIRSSVEFVFFDAEDSGGIAGWSWIQGSTYYVSQLDSERVDSIDAMVLVDMVGDAELQLPRESTSTRSLQNTIWSIANQMGYSETFLSTNGGSILDDHRPFLDAGIAAVDIIHTPFPWYWHTLEDTPDKCSAESLSKVGEVLEVFIVENANTDGTFPLDTPYLIYIGIIVAISLPIIVAFYYYRKRY
ncbi:MAG: M28 family peptidase [Candidatus Thorarchaeota archaeon]|nr:M28 family peptidase [Candidatus Thorarchaeota archaeon]